MSMVKQEYWEEVYSPSAEELLQYELWVHQEYQKEQIKEYYLTMKQRIESGELDKSFQKFIELLGE